MKSCSCPWTAQRGGLALGTVMVMVLLAEATFEVIKNFLSPLSLAVLLQKMGGRQIFWLNLHYIPLYYWPFYHSCIMAIWQITLRNVCCVILPNLLKKHRWQAVIIKSSQLHNLFLFFLSFSLNFFLFSHMVGAWVTKPINTCHQCCKKVLANFSLG